MNTKELIESGVIELYCLGIASEDEVRLVEQLSKKDPAIQEEIASINNVLASYALASSVSQPPSHLKSRILDSIISRESTLIHDNLPPVLSRNSTVEEWKNYLHEINIHEPADYEGVCFMELPGNDAFYSYAVFARPGGIVEEEIHTEHNEYLLICNGECEMTIGGKRSRYIAGDFIELLPGIPHSARVTGTEHMLVIGQRRAA